MTERQCNEEFIWREGMIPDYPHDLNAMHEAEKRMTIPQRDHYTNLLQHIANSNEGSESESLLVNTTCAIVAQRAEALLKTIGKWKD
jgi:hypothetical protein